MSFTILDVFGEVGKIVLTRDHNGFNMVNLKQNKVQQVINYECNAASVVKGSYFICRDEEKGQFSLVFMIQKQNRVQLARMNFETDFIKIVNKLGGLPPQDFLMAISKVKG